MLLDFPEICKEDINNEIALWELLGKKTRWDFIAMVASRKDVLIYGLEPPANGVDAFAPTTYISIETWEKLINWALEQGPEVFELVDQFLDDPENKLEETLATLAHLELITEENVKLALETSKNNFASLLRRQFIKYIELDYDYLLELTKIEIKDALRPDMTLYTTLRDLEAAGEIEYLGGGLYRWQSPKLP